MLPNRFISSPSLELRVASWTDKGRLYHIDQQSKRKLSRHSKTSLNFIRKRDTITYRSWCREKIMISKQPLVLWALFSGNQNSHEHVARTHSNLKRRAVTVHTGIKITRIRNMGKVVFRPLHNILIAACSRISSHFIRYGDRSEKFLDYASIWISPQHSSIWVLIVVYTHKHSSIYSFSYFEIKFGAGWGMMVF